MASTTWVWDRATRFLRTAHQLYQQTGSFRPVAAYSFRYFREKSPLLLSHLRAAVLPRPPIDRTDESRPQISIRVSGGLGDYIVMARFLRDLHAAVEDFVFDIYASTTDSAKWVFADLPGFRACRPDIFFERTKADYDLSMAIHQSLAIDRDEIRWRELRRFPKLLHTCNQLLKYQKEIAVFVEHQPRMDNFLARKAVFADRTRHNFLHHMAEIAFGGNLLPLPFKHVEIPQPYVTVHNGFDPRFIISGSRATKCYPYFADVVAQIKERHPGVAIVQLGTSTSEAMANVDHNLIDRTSLEEVAGLIRNARLHIDNEGGLVHLASCFGVKSCVVFGPTPVDYFGYDENINVPPPICGGCWWINETWMDRCPRLFASPICMAQQDPSKIASLVIAELDRAL